MPTIRRNRYATGDAGISVGMDNIAKMFAPPGAMETLAYAKAGELAKQQARTEQGLAGIASLYGEPVANALRAGVADPGKFQMSVEMARRAAAIPTGGDMSTLDPLVLGQHGVFANTVAGTREAQAAQTGRTNIEQQGALTRAIVTPLGKDTIRVLPPSIASMYDVPTQQTGILEAPMGNNIIVPAAGGAPERVVSGPAKPMDESQMKAAILGKQDPAFQAAVVGSEIKPVQVAGGADGDTPIFRAPNEALGQPAYVAGSTPQVYNYKRPDGTLGAALLSEDGLKDQATGEKLGAGTVFSAPSAGAGENALPTTVTNQAAGRIADIDAAKATAQKFKALVQANPGVQGVVGMIRGTAQDAMAAGGEVGALLTDAHRKNAEDIAKGIIPPELAGNFNPNIPAADYLRHTLVSQAAKALDPGGRLSVDLVKRTEASLGGAGLLSNGPKTNASLDALIQQLDEQRQINARLSPQTAAVSSSATSATPPAAAAPATTAPAPASLPAGAKQAPDGNYYVPDPARPGKFLRVQP